MNEQVVNEIVQLIRDGADAATMALPGLMSQVRMVGIAMVGAGLVMVAIGVPMLTAALRGYLAGVRDERHGTDECDVRDVVRGIAGGLLTLMGSIIALAHIPTALAPGVELLRMVARLG